MTNGKRRKNSEHLRAKQNNERLQEKGKFNGETYVSRCTTRSVLFSHCSQLTFSWLTITFVKLLSHRQCINQKETANSRGPDTGCNYSASKPRLIVSMNTTWLFIHCFVPFSPLFWSFLWANGNCSIIEAKNYFRLFVQNPITANASISFAVIPRAQISFKLITLRKRKTNYTWINKM